MALGEEGYLLQEEVDGHLEACGTAEMSVCLMGDQNKVLEGNHVQLDPCQRWSARFRREKCCSIRTVDVILRHSRQDAPQSLIFG
jgi:hypothetical protein